MLSTATCLGDNYPNSGDSTGLTCPSTTRVQTPCAAYVGQEELRYLQVVIEGSQVQGREAIILRQVNGASGREVRQDELHGSHVAT